MSLLLAMRQLRKQVPKSKFRTWQHAILMKYDHALCISLIRISFIKPLAKGPHDHYKSRDPPNMQIGHLTLSGAERRPHIRTQWPTDTKEQKLLVKFMWKPIIHFRGVDTIYNPLSNCTPAQERYPAGLRNTFKNEFVLAIDKYINFCFRGRQDG
ncbi:hypothetical protein P154DRAFT_581272 [Amniculicola lignicola CBS 123094]|uniref:Uncharacterized protein n=1 Tax=Amniculicola lignicola CBS 123094 TaxID=1392246 RepID=A0A6A5WBG1_9PLEO|nr:hypothetical protein P154DRAFT_581272 [Amniculicola lignicola CBS 123094]